MSHVIAEEGYRVGGVYPHILPGTYKTLRILFGIDYGWERSALIILYGDSKDIGSRSHGVESIKVNYKREDGGIGF